MTSALFYDNKGWSANCQQKFRVALTHKYLYGLNSFNREGAYSQNQMTRIYIMAFQFFYLYILRIQHAFYDSITSIRHSFLPNQIKVIMQICLAEDMESRW